MHSYRVWISSFFLLTLAVCHGRAQQQRTWTVDADFDQGIMMSVNHDTVHDQLQLNRESAVLPFVNVAASKRGTIIRIDANTGEVIGEYRSAPQGEPHNPSRTTVDRAGNVWAANRDQPLQFTQGDGSVIKIGVVVGGTRCSKDGTPNPNGAYLKPPFTYCTAVDRDGDGLIRTSRGLGDIHPWQGADITAAMDECILIYRKIPARNCRHVSVDADNNVWVGGFAKEHAITTTMMKLNGQTGEIMTLRDRLSCGGYGGLVSRQGSIFSSSMNGGGGPLLVMSASGDPVCITDLHSYGLAEDPAGNIWATTFADAMLYKLTPGGSVHGGFPVALEGYQPRGVAVTPVDGHAWIACSGSNEVERRDPMGALVKQFDFSSFQPAGLLPTGVAVDINGKVWVTNAQSDNVFRIDPEGGADRKGGIDLVVPLGAGAYPYNYSDMTGAAYGENVPPYGSWMLVHNGGARDVIWQRISWTARTDGDARIVVRARAANAEAALSAKPYRLITSGMRICDTLLRGQYLQLFVEFYRSGREQNPVLYDLSVMGMDPPAVQADAREFCEGDSIRLIADPRYSDVIWDNGQRTPTRYVSQSGNYWYTALSPAGCRLSSDTIHVTARPAPQPVILAADTVVCAGGETVLTAPPGYRAYRWIPVPGETGPTLRVTSSGSYAVIVVDSLGCSGISPPVSVRMLPRTVVQLAVSGDSVLCGDGPALLEATPGFDTYRWSTGRITREGRLPVDRPGTYHVSVIDSNGCEALSNTVRILASVPPELDLWAAGPPERCHGDTAEIRATPGFAEYRWSSGTHGPDPHLRTTQPGLYWVTVIDDYGCPWTSDTIRVSFLPEVQVRLAIEGDSVLCGDGTARLTATEGFVRYAWSTGEVTAEPYLNVNTAGVYTVRVTGAAGCTGVSNPVRLAFRPRPKTDLWMDGGPVLCSGADGTLHATPGFVYYRWSNGREGRDASITVADSGRYWVEVRDAYGCTARSETLRVTRADELAPVISLDADTLCTGGSLVLDAGAGYATYLWSTGEMTRSITVTAPGRYSVEVTSRSGCRGDTAVHIFEEAPVTVAVSQDTLCPGTSALLDAGPGHTAYAWSTGAVTRSISVERPGTYTVTVTTARGCLTRESVTVHAHVRPEVRLAGSATACPGSTTEYRLEGGSFHDIRWQLDTGGDIRAGDDDTSVAIAWEDAGVHVLRVSFASTAGCRYDTAIEVSVEPFIAPSIEGTRRFCEGGATELFVRSAPGACTWLLPDGGRAEGVARVFADRAGVYTLVVRSGTGCADTVSADVIMDPAPQARILGPDGFCPGDSVTLRSAAASPQCSWQTPAGTVEGTAVNASLPGRYVLEVRTAAGCAARDTLLLRVYPEPRPVITGDSLLAPGDSTLLQVIGSYDRITWHLPDGSQREGSPVVSVRDTGLYRVSVVSAFGCRGSAVFRVRTAGPVSAVSVVGLPRIEAEPGDRIRIPLSLLSSHNLARAGAGPWTARLRFDNSVLMPTGETPVGWTEGSERVVPLVGLLSDGLDDLANLEFIAMLGRTAVTPLRIEQFRWTGADVDVSTVDGEVRLRICQEGGDRLFDASGTLRLAPNHPNPFNAETLIAYELIEDGPTELFVTDMIGRTVRVLFRGYRVRGVHRASFDGTDLPSGTYVCVLRTPTAVRMQRMQLLK